MELVILFPADKDFVFDSSLLLKKDENGKYSKVSDPSKKKLIKMIIYLWFR